MPSEKIEFVLVELKFLEDAISIILGQGSANLSYKRPNSKYFGLYGSCSLCRNGPQDMLPQNMAPGVLDILS